MTVCFNPLPEKLRRYQSGPLGAYIQLYADLLHQQGYTSEYALEKIRQIRDFSRWLERRHVGIKMLDDQHVNVFLGARFKTKSRKHGEMATLTLLLRQLRQKHIIPGRPVKTGQSPTDLIVQNYQQFLLDECNLGQKTVEGYILIARRFLMQLFPDGNVQLNKLRAKDISEFVLRNSTNRGRSSSKLATTTLRSLLRFLFHKGQIDQNLAAAVPTVAGWRLSELPRYLEPAQVERILERCDCRRKVGKRNYAILLLLARLGLRAGEVARLALNDIDWSAGELCIRGKGARIDRLPLLEDVGKAIAGYIQKARPHCVSRSVFVHVKAPYEGFACPPNGISCLVRRALKRANLNPHHKGAHILRHSLATRMLGNGASLTQIGRVLRHKQIQTTEIYAKVNLNALRELAQPWLGGAQ